MLSKTEGIFFYDKEDLMTGKEVTELQKKYNEIKKKGKLPKSTYKPIKSNGNGRPPKRKKKKKQCLIQNKNK